jgi:ectoine hydroxylase-related dioxygenase (phytanoyl-CoA dioxygenase family)
MSNSLLNSSQLREFRNNGVLVVSNFYDVDSEIVPVQRSIYEVIGLVIERHGLEIGRPDFSPHDFDAGFMDVVAADRSFGSEIYDAIKQIPAFIRLVANSQHERVFRELRPGSSPAVASGGFGIRIDIPFEDKFRANWHQEYPAQLRSLDGVVFWSPLLKITGDLGPVEFCLASQKDGPLPVTSTDPRNPNKQGAYALALHNEQELVNRYEHVAPLTGPGDLVIIDFLVLHASGLNRSQRARWTMQFRYFNFREATGMKHGWKGSYAAGVDFRSIHPELCAD